MDNIFTRRSIRKFTDQPVEPEKLERILRAGMQAPSASNLQGWEFIVVTDKETQIAMTKISPYSGAAKNAPQLILVLANMQRVASDPDWWPQDVGACTENILLQIVTEGLGGVWLGIYPKPERVKIIKEIFDLPEHIIPFAMVPFGYTERENKFIDRFDPERIHYEKYE